jgi:hypothetical protein
MLVYFFGSKLERSMIIPNLVNSYGAVLIFGFLPLFGAILLYRFAVTYFNARVHQHWLDRLQKQKPEWEPRRGGSPPQHPMSREYDP